MQQQSVTAPSITTVGLNPAALAIAFGIAGALEVLLFGVVMSATWGMMGGGGGWMHGAAGGGPGIGGGGWMSGGYRGGSMMNGGIGFLVFALFWGFLAGAIAGGASALVYNKVIARSA